MRKTILLAMLLADFPAPVLAADYPVSGKWGVSSGSKPETIDCAGKRVIDFNGNQRTDSNGGAPAYRNRWVTQESSSSWRIVDEFTTGQISNGPPPPIRCNNSDPTESNCG